MPTHAAMPGEVWAYRAKWQDELVPKLVIEIARGTHPKALITLADDPDAGEWVPLLRLKVPWDEVEQFRRNEASWRNLSTVALRERPAEHALMTAFDILIDVRIAEPTFREDGVTVIHDVPALAVLLDIPTEELLTDNTSFYDGPDLVVPWPITLLILTTACRRYPSEILAECDVWEARRARPSRYGGMFTPAERIMLDNELAPSYALLRAWAAPERKQERGLPHADLADLPEYLAELCERVAELSRAAEAILEWASQQTSQEAEMDFSPEKFPE